jgi:hypothetical protein
MRSRRRAVLSWGAQLEDAKKEIAELEQRISALRGELQTVRGPIASATVQRILALREKQLERTKLHAQFIEDEIAQGFRREAKPTRRAAPASTSLSATAKRTVQDEIAKTLGTTFCAEADLTIGEEPTPAGPRTARPLNRASIEPRATGITVVAVGHITPGATHTRMTVVGPGALFPARGPHRA